MANKTRIITSINEWKTFQSESRKVLDSFISGEISDIIYNESCLDTLYISLDKQELKLDLKFYIPIETVFVFSSVVDLISIEKLQGVSNFVFSDCLLGELEIYSSEMSKLSFNNCTIGFLDILSLQAKTVLLMDSHIDELNIIRSKLKRLKIVQTSIDLGNVDLCTFFKSFLKNCYMGKVFIGEVLLPIVKVDIYTKLETNLCLLTYLKSVGIHKYI
ncbi:hypothetical protein MJH12_14230, partial [bacterium]|nr:hypothetical protein [bacterium]